MDINIPNDTGTATAKSVLVQWHGRPRRLVYRHSSDPIKELCDPLESITDTTSLNMAKATYDAVKKACAKFNQRGYPPLAVSIYHNKVVVVARYDNRMYNDKLVRCNVNKATYIVDETKKCLDAGNQKLYITVIYRDDLANWIDQWKTLKLVANWSPVGQNSGVRFYVGGNEVKDWSGLLGRSYKYGPYMKYGIYAHSSSKNFKVKIKNASSVVNNSK